MKVLSFVQLKVKKLIIVPQKLILTSLLFIIIYTSIIYFYGIKIKVIEKWMWWNAQKLGLLKILKFSIHLNISNYLILGCRCSLNEETTRIFDSRQWEIKWSASAVYLGKWNQGNENDSEECSPVP